MEIQFMKTSPTENMTVLIETPVPVEQQLAVAEKLIAYNSVYGEQAGFIQESGDRRAEKALRMMAGEFCGNATLSLAAWLMEKRNVPVGKEVIIYLEVSGAEGLVKCQIQRETRGYYGTVEMPLPLSIDEEVFLINGEKYTFPVVRFAGIVHIVVDRKAWDTDAKKMAEQAAVLWAERMPMAFGILLWDEETKQLEPLVCLQGTSLVWERGCGSGTAAIGAYLAMKRGGDVALQCHEPGGIMGVEARMRDGKISGLSISGHVDIVAVGKAYI